MNKTVTVYLRGGLGNQMFQYVAGLAAARANGAEILLDTVYLADRTPRAYFAYRDLDLDIFRIALRKTWLSRIATKFRIPAVWLFLDLAWHRLLVLVGREIQVSEPKMYVPDPRLEQPVNRNIFLYGFWQVWDYAAHIESDVRQAFAFKESLTGPMARMAVDIQSVNSVAVHVRRGDYILPRSMAVVGVASEGYYERAVKLVSARISDPVFFIFSDDIGWCRQNLKFPGRTVFVGEELSGPKNSGHLHLMSLCRSHIIANSTFSWWGAWLNPTPNRLVILPAQWNVQDAGIGIAPPDWVRL